METKGKRVKASKLGGVGVREAVGVSASSLQGKSQQEGRCGEKGPGAGPGWVCSGPPAPTPALPILQFVSE